MWLQGQHLLTWEGALERRGDGCICRFCPSSGGLLFGCRAAARGLGKGVLELASTAAFGFDVRRRRFVAVTAGGSKANAETGPSCPSSGVADDSWNEREKTPASSLLPRL